jgi:hypothetical protein
VIFLSGFFQFVSYVVGLPELACFSFKFKRVVVWVELVFRIGFEFGGHLASHYTRKHMQVGMATYNLFEVFLAYIEVVHVSFPLRKIMISSGVVQM